MMKFFVCLLLFSLVFSTLVAEESLSPASKPGSGLSLIPDNTKELLEEKKYAGIPESDWKYLESNIEKRDRSLLYPIAYMAGGYLLTIGGAFVFYTKEELQWTDINFQNFKDNIMFKTYRWDSDRFFFNYVSHPFTGSEAYLRMRMRGFNGLESWIFAFTASAVWEYGVEGWVEPVSFQDMVVTPCAGALFGELRFRAKLYFKKQNNIGGSIGNFVIDPLQSMVEGVYSLFGGKKEDAPKTAFYFFYDNGKRRYYF